MSSCASPTLDTSPILNLTKVTSVAISPCQNIVAIAQGSSLVVARWNNVDYDEMCRKDMGGGSIQSVTVISPHCIVYSTQNSGFVTFDPTTCRHRGEFSSIQPRGKYGYLYQPIKIASLI
jgi:hypothetical protein